jgi:hypothetical protein
MILSTANGGYFLSFEFRNGRRSVSLVIVHREPKLSVVVAPCRVNLSVVLTNKNAVVVTASCKRHNLFGQRFNLFWDRKTSKIALTELPSLVKTEAVGSVILIYAYDVLTAIVSEYLFDLYILKLDLFEMACPRSIFAGSIPILRVFIGVIIGCIRLVIIGDIQLGIAAIPNIT